MSLITLWLGHDLMVVCDESKVMDKMNCEGVPDFILEVVSKNSAGKDLV